MKTRNIILSGVTILVVLVALNTMVFAYTSGTGVTIPSPVSIYTVKKVAMICDDGASAPPYQSPPEVGGCVDAFGVRANEYLFTGEQLAILVVARDLDTSLALPTTAQLMIDGSQKMECLALTDAQALKLKSGPLHNCQLNPAFCWYGHDVSGLLGILPPQMGISDPVGFSTQFDKVYQCLLTVTPDMNGNPSNMTVLVKDLNNNTATTNFEKWYFNPGISASISFDSGTSVLFPAAQAGQTVYSTNTMLIKNTALGGVDMAVYLVGNDLKDTSGIGICLFDAVCSNAPAYLTNVLNINNIAFRCKVGTVMAEEFTPLSHMKEANGCNDFRCKECYVEDGWCHDNTLLPQLPAIASILWNGHTAECWFQLEVPLPCIGAYSASNAVEVLVRAI